MKKELEDNKGELEPLNGYKRLYGFTEALINLILSYKKAINALDNAIESLKKEK